MSLTDLLEMQHLTYTRKKKSKRRVGAKSLVHTGYLLLGNRPSVLLEISEMKGKYIISEKKMGVRMFTQNVLPKVRRNKRNTHFISNFTQDSLCRLE